MSQQNVDLIRRMYSVGEAMNLDDLLAALPELERHFQRSHYQADDALVFCHSDTGKPYDASKLRRRFRAAVKRAGVREVRFHDLRHSYGTAMAGAGAPLRSLMEWMGHADLQTTLRYADYSPGQAQGAAFAEAAFGAGTNSGTNLSATEDNSDQESVPEDA